MHTKLIAAALLTAVALLGARRTATAPTIETAFSPRGTCATLTENALNAATATIDIAAYEFTQMRLINATLRAQTRGVQVRIILDRAQERSPAPGPDAARRAGLAIRTDAAEKLHHNKYVIIDGQTVITGSYNWSDNAEQWNAENLVQINDSATAAAFAADFAKHWAHSRPYTQYTPRPRKQKTTARHFTTTPPPAKKGFLQWHAFTVPCIPTLPAVPPLAA